MSDFCVLSPSGRLTVSLLRLSKVALTKSAPSAKPSVSSVFPMHVCQRGVHDCAPPPKKKVNGDSSEEGRLAKQMLGEWPSINATAGWCDLGGDAPSWCRRDFPGVYPERSRNVDPGWRRSSEPGSTSCSCSTNYAHTHTRARVGKLSQRDGLGRLEQALICDKLND